MLKVTVSAEGDAADDATHQEVEEAIVALLRVHGVAAQSARRQSGTWKVGTAGEEAAPALGECG